MPRTRIRIIANCSLPQVVKNQMRSEMDNEITFQARIHSAWYQPFGHFYKS